MDNIPFEGQITEADFRKINALAARKVYIILVSFNALLLFLLSLPYWHNPRELIQMWPIIGTGAFVFLIGHFSVKRAWKKNQIIKGPFKGIVSEEGITWTVENISSATMRFHIMPD